MQKIFKRWLCIKIYALFSLFCFAEEVKQYKEKRSFSVKYKGGNISISQKCWILENKKIRFAVTDDPGGAVVEFLNKDTGTNYVAGEVYSAVHNKKTVKQVYWGWKNMISDNKTDPIEKQMHYQKYNVEFEKGKNGERFIKVTGKTEEQKIERWHSLKPNSSEVLINMKLTNIAKHSRRLWMRWHPYMFISKDRYGDHGCVLSPENDVVTRKIRVGWGFDHWFKSHESYWLGYDFKLGEGLFTTFEKDKVPIHFTWTSYKPRSPLKGALTMEPFPEALLKAPGESVEMGFSYTPLDGQTNIEEIGMGMIKDLQEQKRAKAFLAKTHSAKNMQLVNGYTFSNTIQFDWLIQRIDRFALRPWGFADCAIVGFPTTKAPVRVRMVGGLFKEALHISNFPKDPQLNFRVFIKDEEGHEVYQNGYHYKLKPGLSGQNSIDREHAIPMDGIGDGFYTLRVEVVDPMKPSNVLHFHENEIEIFEGRLNQLIENKKSSEIKTRSFVVELGKHDGELNGGVLSIPIGIEDASGMNRRNFPVRLGVPFQMGLFKNDVKAKLYDRDGREIAVDVNSMNVWHDKSLKWLEVNFQALCPANSHVFYTLKVEANKSIEEDSLLAVEEGNVISIDTGPMLVRIKKDKINIPGDIFIDQNKNGLFEVNEQLVYSSEKMGTWWTDQNQTSYLMSLKGPSTDGFSPSVEIESNHRESAIIKVKGWYESPNELVKPAFGEVRIEVFKGKSFLKLWHQVTFTGVPWHHKLASYGLRLNFKPGFYDEIKYELDGKSMVGGESMSLLQKRVNQVMVDGNLSGRKSTGAISMSGKFGSTLFYHRDFWQMYPKKVQADVTSGEMVIHYWPKEAGVYDFSPEEKYWISKSSSPEACGTGVSRTQEMILDFSSRFQPHQAEPFYGEPVIAVTPPKWVQKTKVLGNLYPYNPKRYPDIEELQETLATYFESNRQFFNWYGHWNHGTLHNIFKTSIYQWLLVSRFANIGNEDGIVQSPWLQYFRSGDRRYYKWGRIWTRHLMEVQSIRYNHIFPEYVGMSRRHHYTAWIGGGDWGHSMLCPFLEYYHADGYKPSWEMAKRMAKAMDKTYSGAWRYISNPLVGSIRMYSETGDEAYKRTADRIWKDLCFPDKNQWMSYSHGSRMALWYGSFNKDCMKLAKAWSKEGRDVGGRKKVEFKYIDLLGTIGDMTDDSYYTYKTRWVFDKTRSLDSGQIKAHHPVYHGGMFIPSQSSIGLSRRSLYAAGQIEKFRKVFPASYVNARDIKGLVFQEKEDKDITLWIGSNMKREDVQILGPDGRKVPIVTQKMAQVDNCHFIKIRIKKDGKTGFYRMPIRRLYYLGASLKNIAIMATKRIDYPSGAPLYSKTNHWKELGKKVLLQRTPVASLEIMDHKDRVVFSQTLVRSAKDNIAKKYTLNVLPNSWIKLRDKVGLVIPNCDALPLYLNKDGVFDIPKNYWKIN